MGQQSSLAYIIHEGEIASDLTGRGRAMFGLLGYEYQQEACGNHKACAEREPAERQSRAEHVMIQFLQGGEDIVKSFQRW